MFTFVARQAVYDTKKRVFAYELLFRDGVSNCFPEISPDEATSSMLAESHLSIGVENLCFNKPAFINFHQDTILYRFPSTLDPLSVVIEIVESVEVTPAFLKACEHIKNMGYKIALDDYDFSATWDPLLPFVRYVKVESDLLDLSNQALMLKIETLKQQGKILIAEKIETSEEFERFKNAGFDYFQGYFLSKPEVVKHKNVDILASSVVQLVALSSAADFDFDKVSEVCEKDVGLTYKLMRFINNPLFNKRQKIDSLHHALRYLGTIELKKFIALLAIANLKGNKPIDLIVSSLVRAHFCKLMAASMELKENPPSSYILGLFSHIDALMDMPMTEIMQSLPFSDEVKQALCEIHTNSKLALQLRLCFAFERADWAVIYELSDKAGIKESELFKMYYASVQWADDMKSTLTEN
ncbi:EAL and HDOD domain-containing protein [Glaciecola sp. SC05]|uniref:EAL and HDOD domain-containing protein n=1 Tax=Glaciecola sp. SC05 TaxID=1987355 RepID=UPI003529585F